MRLKLKREVLAAFQAIACLSLVGCGGGVDAQGSSSSATAADSPDRRLNVGSPVLAPTTAAATTTTESPTASAPVAGPSASPPGVPNAATALSASCAALYPSNFALNSGRSIDAVPAMAKPVKGVEYVEPSYKTCMVRATDHAAERIDGFVRNDYSRRQAFNANSSKYVAYALNGSWRLYDGLTNAHLKALPGPAGDAEIQWHATNPDLLYYVPLNGVGMRLYELNVVTGVSRVVGDFGARLKAKWPSASAAWTKSEGSPSKDGRYWCFMVDSVSANGQWKGLGLFTWDRDTDKIVGMVEHPGGVRPDHVSMSPSGNYCVWSGNTVQAFTRDLKQRSTVVAQGEHSDLALDANGDDVFVSVDYQTNSGELYMVNLRTKQRTSLLPTYIAGTATALHISGKAFNKPGWMLLSTYSDYGDAGRQWMHRKVMAVQLKASPKVYNLAFTRAAPNGYWAEPHATVNRDFTRVMFNSNWGSASDSNLDAYIVQLPVGALK